MALNIVVVMARNTIERLRAQSISRIVIIQVKIDGQLSDKRVVMPSLAIISAPGARVQSQLITSNGLNKIKMFFQQTI